MDTNCFEIPANNYDTFKAEMTRLNRKAQRLGYEEFTFGPLCADWKEVPEGSGKFVKYLTVLLTAPQIKIADWEFIAKIEHDAASQGNMIFKAPDKEFPEKYLNATCSCEHCNRDRVRNTTYILRHTNTLEYKQVGKTCLQDFIGIDPHAFAKMMEYYVKAVRSARDSFEYFGRGDYINTKAFMEYAAKSVLQDGFHKRDSQFPTASRALDYYEHYTHLTTEEVDLAAKTIEHFTNIQVKNDFDQNMKTIASSEYISINAIGIAAYMVYGYMKYTDTLKARRADSDSKHFANVGDRITVKVAVTLRKSVESNFGTSLLVKMKTEDGNIVTTFSSGSFRPNVGDEFVLQARVKKNDTYNGVAQTAVSHCKVIKD